jgi:hypothetical protein
VAFNSQFPEFAVDHAKARTEEVATYGGQRAEGIALVLSGRCSRSMYRGT